MTKLTALTGKTVISALTKAGFENALRHPPFVFQFLMELVFGT